MINKEKQSLTKDKENINPLVKEEKEQLKEQKVKVDKK